MCACFLLAGPPPDQALSSIDVAFVAHVHLLCLDKPGEELLL